MARKIKDIKLHFFSPVGVTSLSEGKRIVIKDMLPPEITIYYSDKQQCKLSFPEPLKRKDYRGVIICREFFAIITNKIIYFFDECANLSCKKEIQINPIEVHEDCFVAQEANRYIVLDKYGNVIDSRDLTPDEISNIERD